MKEEKIVLVEWVDSNVTHGWREGESVAFDSIARCRTVGIVKIDDREKIVLAFGDSESGMVLETISIPKGCVVKVRSLRL
jgi:hypothetical protein